MVAVASVISGGAVLPGDSVAAPNAVATAAHVLEFAVFAALAWRATHARSRALVAIGLSLLLGLATEAAQLLAIERSADVADLAADLLGAELGVLAAVATWGRRRSDA